MNQITGKYGFWAINGLVIIKVGDVVQRTVIGAIAHLPICGGFIRKQYKGVVTPDCRGGGILSRMVSLSPAIVGGFIEKTTVGLNI